MLDLFAKTSLRLHYYIFMISYRLRYVGVQVYYYYYYYYRHHDHLYVFNKVCILLILLVSILPVFICIIFFYSTLPYSSTLFFFSVYL
jgi:hypothetical protein